MPAKLAKSSTLMKRSDIAYRLDDEPHPKRNRGFPVHLTAKGLFSCLPDDTV